MALEYSQGDSISGKITRKETAAAVVAALGTDAACNKTFEVSFAASAVPDWHFCRQDPAGYVPADEGRTLSNCNQGTRCTGQSVQQSTAAASVVVSGGSQQLAHAHGHLRVSC